MDPLIVLVVLMFAVIVLISLGEYLDVLLCGVVMLFKSIGKLFYRPRK